MTPAAVLTQARAEGLTLSLEPPDTIVIRGPREVRVRWLPEVRALKPELLALLSSPAPVAPDPGATWPGPEPPAEAPPRSAGTAPETDTEPRRLWLVTAPAGEPFSTSYTPPATRQEVERWHHGAEVQPEPPAPEQPPAILAPGDEAEIRAWLASIGEIDQGAIVETLERCRRDPVALSYFIGRAQEANQTPDPDAPRFWFWRIDYADGSSERIEFDSPAALADVQQRRPVAVGYEPQGVTVTPEALPVEATP
jgi:hypothetical protein